MPAMRCWPAGSARAARGHVDARHRLDHALAAPVALPVPVDELAARRPQRDDPLGVLHAVTAGHQDARRVAVLARQHLAVHLVHEQRLGVEGDLDRQRGRELVGRDGRHERARRA